MKLTDFKKMAVVTEDLRLMDRRSPVDNMPVRVRVFWDEASSKAYQVDFDAKEYRDSKSALGPYGAWKKLSE